MSNPTTVNGQSPTISRTNLAAGATSVLLDQYLTKSGTGAITGYINALSTVSGKTQSDLATTGAMTTLDGSTATPTTTTITAIQRVGTTDFINITWTVLNPAAYAVRTWSRIDASPIMDLNYVNALASSTASFTVNNLQDPGVISNIQSVSMIQDFTRCISAAKIQSKGIITKDWIREDIHNQNWHAQEANQRAITIAGTFMDRAELIDQAHASGQEGDPTQYPYQVGPYKYISGLANAEAYEYPASDGYFYVPLMDNIPNLTLPL